jgi:FixJ family two-component response regulator
MLHLGNWSCDGNLIERTHVEKPPVIAVVDDDPYVRRGLERLFRSAGFSVEAFESGPEFLRSADDHEPGCVVLDLQMPELDGIEVQAQLQRAHPDVPVIIITGHETADSRSRALEGGAKAYLCKPVDDKELLRSIKEAMVA